jgi:AsmA protein
MKRLGAPIAACAAIVAIGLFITSWLIDRDAVRQAVESQLRAATGFDLVVSGEIDVSLFPGSYVTLHKVGLKSDGNTTEPTLSADSLTANLRLLPILMRRFEIADVTLDHPHLNVTRDANGHSNWTPIVEMLVRTLRPDTENPVSFSEIRIKNGVLTYRDDERHVLETVTGADMSFAWPSISRSFFAATGQLDWRGERIDGSFSIADFVAALSGERSSLKARIAGAPLKLAFDGAIANRTNVMMEGVLTVDAISLRDALHWTGHNLPGNSGFGRFALKARANIIGPSIALTNVNMEIDDNIAEGVLTYSNDNRSTLQATLASDALDITPYVNTIRLLANGARDWNRQSFDLRGLSATDLDVRFSAAKVTAGTTKFGRTAIGANLRDGTLALSVGEAQIFGGILKGSFGLARSGTDTTATAETAANVKTQFQFNDVDLEAFAGDVLGNKKITGRGNLNITLEASGSSSYELAQSLDGTVSLTGHDGALMGFNVEQLLRRLERRPLSGAGEFRSGRTPFNTLNIALKFDHGIATTDDAKIEGPSARLTLSGTASVPAREYDLKGVASLASAPDSPPAFELPFVVQGPWDDPLIFPDSDALIRRSPASAPLLNAVRDSRTRDTVRSVIDRLKGAPKPASAPTPETPTPAAALPLDPAPSARPN